ncbi:MAG: Spy/CpxP family protein refolding chaperone, partial [Okeania sp. SIO2D1]|nr:Spy/CpxP family protein refolding chaperone [Okeania sp. SIO2D1]
GKGMRWLQELDLTSEQQERIQAIHEQAKADMESLHQQMQEAREQMTNLMSGNASAEQLRNQQDKIQALHEQLGDKRFETMLAVREILTPEQREQLAQLKEQHRQEHGNRRRQGGPQGEFQGRPNR